MFGLTLMFEHINLLNCNDKILIASVLNSNLSYSLYIVLGEKAVSSALKIAMWERKLGDTHC